MASYVFNTPSGTPGALTRPQETIVEPGVILDNVNLNYGDPVLVDSSGIFEPIVAGTPVSTIYGFLSRNAPSIAGNGATTFNSGVPNVDATQGIATLGFMNAVCVFGSPFRGQAVYVRNLAGSSIYRFGALSNTNVDGTFSLLPNAIWYGNGIDSNQVGEIRFSFQLPAFVDSGGTIGGYPVVLTSPMAGDLLTFTGTSWLNIPQSELGTGISY